MKNLLETTSPELAEMLGTKEQFEKAQEEKKEKYFWENVALNNEDYKGLELYLETN